MTLVPEHRPCFYVRCDDCLFTSNTVEGTYAWVLECAARDYGFVEEIDEEGTKKHYCDDCAEKRKKEP